MPRMIDDRYILRPAFVVSTQVLSPESCHRIPHPGLSIHPRREVSDGLKLMGGMKMSRSNHPWVLFVSFLLKKKKKIST